MGKFKVKIYWDTEVEAEDEGEAEEVAFQELDDLLRMYDRESVLGVDIIPVENAG